MDAGLTAILGALIGASSGILSGLDVEAFSRYRDARATALAIASSIDTLLWIAEKRGQVEHFRSLLTKLETNEPVQFFGFVDDNNIQDEIAQKHTEKLGLLWDDLGAKVVRFFTIVICVRMDIVNLKSGMAGDNRSMTALIRQDLMLWAEAESIGRRLVADLQKPPPRLWRRCVRYWLPAALDRLVDMTPPRLNRLTKERSAVWHKPLVGPLA